MKRIDLENLYRRYFKEIYLFLKSLSSSEEVAEEIFGQHFSETFLTPVIVQLL
ncbi:hypothetical protein [Desulfitobacterium hafniense]|uniref:hypothetical protein n=1 Tax=Desulfitobacterium hafniense TaxID=49338 RepID=UPI000AD2335C|nr:hypothetical protein [Desulfitobacterium hafniense]